MLLMDVDYDFVVAVLHTREENMQNTRLINVCVWYVFIQVVYGY